MSSDSFRLIGTGLGAVIAYLETAHYPWKITKMDDTLVRNTMEYTANCVYLEVHDDVVTKVINFDGMVYEKGKAAISVQELNLAARAEKEAKLRYYASTENDPVIHCNRFPSWEELSDDQKANWYSKNGI